MSNIPLLSIVVPCFNERENLSPIAERFAPFVQRLSFEVLLVDNGSFDGSWEELLELKNRYQYIRPVRIPQNIGYGNGIITGLAHAKGEVFAWTHADLQTDPEDIFRAYETFSQLGGKRVVKGRRNGRPLCDRIFTGGMSALAALLLGTWLTDINAQPKLFGRDFSKCMKNPPPDFSLDIYWIYLAKREKYSILEIPVEFHERRFGVSKSAPTLMEKVRTSIRTARYIFRLRNYTS